MLNFQQPTKSINQQIIAIKNQSVLSTLSQTLSGLVCEEPNDLIGKNGLSKDILHEFYIEEDNERYRFEYIIEGDTIKIVSALLEM